MNQGLEEYYRRRFGWLVVLVPGILLCGFSAVGVFASHSEWALLQRLRAGPVEEVFAECIKNERRIGQSTAVIHYKYSVDGRDYEGIGSVASVEPVTGTSSKSQVSIVYLRDDPASSMLMDAFTRAEPESRFYTTVAILAVGLALVVLGAFLRARSKHADAPQETCGQDTR